MFDYQTAVQLLPDDQVEELIDKVHFPEAVSPSAISERVNYEPNGAVAVNEDELFGNEQQQDQQDHQQDNKQDDKQDDKPDDQQRDQQKDQ